jgi:hypothetical protein
VGYQHYKVLFPRLKDATGGGTNSMQISEFQFYKDAAATPGQEILAAANPILGIRYGDLSRYPAAEGPANLIDGLNNTKYLNFGKATSGAIITQNGTAYAVDSMQLVTANDVPNRDPASYELWGTNSPILSQNNSDGLAEAWTLISSGALSLPAARMDGSTIVPIGSATAYQSYKLVFPTLKDPNAPGVDSMQLAGVQFFAVPEPSSWLLVACGALAVLGVRRRAKDRRP